MALWTSDEPASSTVAVQAIQGGAVDGLIFTTATPTTRRSRQAVSQRLPIVLVNRSISGLQCDQVTSDNVGGGRLVAEYFLAHGHTDVAVVGGNDLISTGRERRQGFVGAFAEHGIEIPPHRQPECDFTHDAARSVGLELLGHPNPPSAVFCVNDLVAFGVQDAAIRLGIADARRPVGRRVRRHPDGGMGPDRPDLGTAADRVAGEGRRGEPRQADQEPGRTIRAPAVRR